MNATDRTPIVIALVADIIFDRGSGDDHFPASLATLARALTGVAASSTAVADLWPPTGHDEAAARWVAAVLLGEEPREARDGTDCLVVATAVSRRLADVAVSLRVRGDAWRDEAFALWDAASRLSGFETMRKVGRDIAEARGMTGAKRPKAKDLRARERWCAKDSGLFGPLSPEAKAARMPPPPDTLVGALQDRVHIDMPQTGPGPMNAALLRLRDERDEARAEIERLKGAERYGGRLVDSMTETMEARTEVERWRRWAVEKTGADPSGGDTFLRAAIQVHINPDIDRLTRAHAEEVARLTEQLATARADLEEALRSATSAGPVTSASEADAIDTRKPEPWYAIRNTILRAGARDCVVCHTSAGVVLRVNLGDSLTLGTVQDLIADAGRPRGSYKIIVSGTIERG